MDSIYLSSLSNSSYDLSLLSDQGQAAVVVLYTSTAILSFTSNLLAIYIIVHRDRLHHSEIWLLLTNLSVADILMAIFCIPFTYTTFMLGRWIFPPWWCPLVQAAQHCSVFVSVYTLTIIGFDRYFAIVYPFHGLNYLKTHKVHVLLLIWLAGVLFASIQLFQTEAVAFRNGNETYYDCKELWGELEGKCFTLFVFVVTFALPVSALVFVYVSIGRHIIGRTAPGNPDSVRDSIRANIKVKVIKMLVTIVIVFVVCWLPLQVSSIIVWFYPPSMSNAHAYQLYIFVAFLCHWLAMAHSFLNPFIYGFMSENFKIKLHQTFCGGRRAAAATGRRRRGHHTNPEAEMERLSTVSSTPHANTTATSNI